MEQGRTGENWMQLQGNQQQPPPPPPPRRRPENQMAAQNHNQPPPPQKCPRCDSPNTKFCYYNNYSLSQPRYFCKACRRYWTNGGTLRNVPIGGGCRKGKRPKPPISSSSSTGRETARTQPAVLPPQNNLTGVISGQASRAPVMPSMGGNNNSFYAGGAFLSSLSAMQSLPAGINQAAATANFSAGNSQYDANMALLQSLQSLKSHHMHHQTQNEIFPSQQSLNISAARPALNSWTQSFIRGSAGSSAGPSSNFWSRAAGDGENQAGLNPFNPNQWPDNNNNNNAGFDPSR